MLTSLMAVVTGSKSARLLWEDEGMNTAYAVYRATVPVFGSAVLIASVPANTEVYNDYVLSPTTQYFYWLLPNVDAVLSNMATMTTNDPAMAWPIAEVIEDALYTWAFSEFLGKFPVLWVRQGLPKSQKPFVTLKLLPIDKPGLTDDERSMGEALVGARVLTVQAALYTDPTPPARVQFESVLLATGTYTVTIGAETVSKVYVAPPVSKLALMTDLVALLNGAGLRAVVDGLVGSEGFQVENADGSDITSFSSTPNLLGAYDTPADSFQMASQLQGSLGDPEVRLKLQKAGIGVGTVEGVADISALLDTKFEVRAQFNFKANINFSRPISSPVIDSVPDLSGTIVP